MKQYVFIINTNNVERDLIINAKGMTDAFKQVTRRVKSDDKTQTKLIKFKGVKY
ncbi:hypothetical protein [uncultured Metabacillus sp.]|uniref:hypothetical protein n=1 Tax=Metabacillus sp. Hm71 TaxID=3450743 RepID=UPI00261E8261|nr:hypothetical protein [uncultured Metabacillus sp.]